MQAPSDWSGGSGSQSLVSMIQKQIEESNEKQQQSTCLCSIQCDGAEPAETFLPSQAFEANVAGHPRRTLAPQGTKALTGSSITSQALQDMREALRSVPVPPIPCPYLDTMSSEVCYSLQAKACYLVLHKERYAHTLCVIKCRSEFVKRGKRVCQLCFSHRFAAAQPAHISHSLPS